MIAHPKLFTAALCSLLLLGGGCAKHSEPAQFYRLQALATDTYQPATQHLLLGIGPIHLPAYLDRPQIVTAEREPRYRFDEFHRWAEPLQDNFIQVLADDLANALPVSQSSVFPWPSSLGIDYQVRVEVSQLHAGDDGTALVDARWSIWQGKQAIMLRRSRLSETAPADAAGQVAALSRLVARLSSDIAKGISIVVDQPR